MAEYYVKLYICVIYVCETNSDLRGRRFYLKITFVSSYCCVCVCTSAAKVAERALKKTLSGYYHQSLGFYIFVYLRGHYTRNFIYLAGERCWRSVFIQLRLSTRHYLLYHSYHHLYY